MSEKFLMNDEHYKAEKKRLNIEIEHIETCKGVMKQSSINVLIVEVLSLRHLTMYLEKHQLNVVNAQIIQQLENE